MREQWQAGKPMRGTARGLTACYNLSGGGKRVLWEKLSMPLMKANYCGSSSGQVVVHFEPLRHMECAYYVAGTLRVPSQR